ncbi:MAG: YidC/Oxa1 family membrane protein insertase [Anaerostipes sp.]|nr:YidC/Oxa1 family membrane protein insertase [Anaerostipes sp.]
MMVLAQATSSGGILAPIVKLFGYIMQYIYIGLSHFGILNLGVCIIIFTLISKLIIFPLTIKQQKTMKINQIAQPEINKIQKKYRNKRDNASMMKQQEEMNAVYAKYGTSPTGGCATTLIQFPIIMSLYYVVRNLEGYIPDISKTAYTFIFGIDIQNAPGFRLTPYLIIPLASVIFQYLTMRTSMSNMDSDNPAAGMSKSMMLMMPLMSLFMCITLPAALGIYWAASAAFQFIQQVLIDTYYDHADMDKIIGKQREKYAKKKSKKGPSMYEKMMNAATGQPSADDLSNGAPNGSISSVANKKSNKTINYDGNNTGGIASKANSVSRSDKGGK